MLDGVSTSTGLGALAVTLGGTRSTDATIIVAVAKFPLTSVAVTTITNCPRSAGVNVASHCGPASVMGPLATTAPAGSRASNRTVPIRSLSTTVAAIVTEAVMST